MQGTRLDLFRRMTGHHDPPVTQNCPSVPLAFGESASLIFQPSPQLAGGHFYILITSDKSIKRRAPEKLAKVSEPGMRALGRHPITDSLSAGFWRARARQLYMVWAAISARWRANTPWYSKSSLRPGRPASFI